MSEKKIMSPLKTYVPTALVLVLLAGCAKETPVPAPEPVDPTPEETELKSCTVENITDDIIFSTVCAARTTSVQQSFDFNAAYDTVYFSQVTANHRNTIGWARRKQLTNETAPATDRMILYYFSHGNNIRYERESDGTDYLWIGNYGTLDRDNNNTYTAPQILSRIKIENGATMKNFQATDNYYFGLKNIHASFDVENDHLAIFSSYVVRIYRLSDVLNTPVTQVTLKESITYGGEGSPDEEYTGRPTIQAHDCSGMTPLSKFTYNYTSAGRGWQTFCIKDGRVYFFLFDKNSTSDMAFQSTLDIFDFNGKLLKDKILQPFSDNINDLYRYGFTDPETRYMENEGILIRDGAMYLLYTAKNAAGLRRPVIFKFAVPEV